VFPSLTAYAVSSRPMAWCLSAWQLPGPSSFGGQVGAPKPQTDSGKCGCQVVLQGLSDGRAGGARGCARGRGERSPDLPWKPVRGSSPSSRTTTSRNSTGIGYPALKPASADRHERTTGEHPSRHMQAATPSADRAALAGQRPARHTREMSTVGQAFVAALRGWGPSDPAAGRRASWPVQRLLLARSPGSSVSRWLSSSW
jgi:hypothetical protein